MAVPKGERKARKVRRIAKARRTSVRREEFNQLIDMLNERGELLNRVLREQDIQFQRIAQLQAELDHIKQAWSKLRRPPLSSYPS